MLFSRTIKVTACKISPFHVVTLTRRVIKGVLSDTGVGVSEEPASGNLSVSDVPPVEEPPSENLPKPYVSSIEEPDSESLQMYRTCF